jgi:uncharacterized protein YxjI
MITVKILCGCGQKYAFDVEPYNGRMPAAVQCPICKADGTAAANDILARTLPPVPVAAPAPVRSLQPAPPPPTAAGLRINKPAPAAEVSSAGPGEYAQGDGISLLNHRIFLVKERVAMLKFTDTYDIFDPASNRQIGIAKEVTPVWITLLRFLIDKGKLPTKVNIFEDESQPPVASIQRGFTFLRSKIKVTGPGGKPLGYFRSKLISIGGGFHVFDNNDQQVAEVKGNWKGWDFRFLSKSGRELGAVTKKWAGLGKELFTSADNYVISLSDIGSASPEAGALLLAAGLAIDIVFKEGV